MHRFYFVVFWGVLVLFLTDMFAQDAGKGKVLESNPTVRLLESGSEPKQKLRFVVKKGSVNKGTIITKMEMNISFGDRNPQRITNPPIKVVMSARVTETRNDGTIKYEFNLDKADAINDGSVPEQMVSGIRDALRSVEGIKGYEVVTDRGYSQDVSFSLPQNINPQVKEVMENMKNSLAKMSAPLPEEPVGQGAIWEVDNELLQNGVRINQRVIYKLKQCSEKRCKIDIELKQTAGKQIMTSPNLPSGASVELQELQGSGKGEMEINLEQLFPIKSSLQSSHAFTMKVSDGVSPEPQIMKMTMKMNMELTGQRIEIKQ